MSFLVFKLPVRFLVITVRVSNIFIRLSLHRVVRGKSQVAPSGEREGECTCYSDRMLHVLDLRRFLFFFAVFYASFTKTASISNGLIVTFHSSSIRFICLIICLIFSVPFTLFRSLYNCAFILLHCRSRVFLRPTKTNCQPFSCYSCCSFFFGNQSVTSSLRLLPLYK